MATLNTKLLPEALPIKKLLGPSFIILALGLGSGEVILWPYLTANYGLGLAWAALLGITFQYFINMEIERYALARGESVFVGIATIFRHAPYWFIASTFLGFGLPGIIAASAEVLSVLLGIEDFKWLAMAMLVVIGITLSVGKTVYEMMERITRTIIFLGIPFVFILALSLSTATQWGDLARGLVGQGNTFWLIPSGISLATFLAAFAYSGAGGNLNLTQSIYIKEKGYGMGVYSQKISGLFKNFTEEQRVRLGGEVFEITPDNMRRWKTWWCRVSFEHAMIFWFLGFVGIVVLMLLSYTTAFGLDNNESGIHFVINEGATIGTRLTGAIGALFLFVVSVMLFQTQLGILDSTSRIMAENVAIKKIDAVKNKSVSVNLSKIYFIFVWSQIAFGILLFLFNIYEPRGLIVLGAVLNAVAMFVHIALVNWTNHKMLPREIHPPLWRKIILVIIFIFFGGFSMFTLWQIFAPLIS